MGQKVEVRSQAKGFLGSCYEATVIYENTSIGHYVVEYRNLVEEKDESRLLMEVVSADEVRPVPPKRKPFNGVFGLYDKVDAFDNDGWWKGKVTGMQGSRYFVYFDSTREELPYPASRLRVHQDWINGKWA